MKKFKISLMLISIIIMSSYKNLKSMKEFFGETKIHRERGNTPDSIAMYEIQEAQTKLYNSDFFKYSFATENVEKRCSVLKNYFEDIEKILKEYLQTNKQISLKPLYDTLENKLCYLINDLYNASKTGSKNFSSNYDKLLSIIKNRLDYTSQTRELFKRSFNELSRSEYDEITKVKNFKNMIDVNKYKNGGEFYNFAIKDVLIKIIKKIEQDFKFMFKVYSKEEVMNLLNASAKDLFFSGLKLKDFPDHAQRQEIIKLLTEKAQIANDLNKKDSVKKLETEIDKIKINPVIITLLDRWQDSLEALNIFLKQSGSKDLPKYFNKIMYINDSIFSKLIPAFKNIRNEIISKSVELGKTNVITSSEKNTILIDLSRKMTDLEQSIKHKEYAEIIDIYRGIDNITIFAKDKKEARELLKMLTEILIKVLTKITYEFKEW